MQGINPVVIVTGGGSGVGQAAAVEFAERGSAVAVVGRDHEKLQGTVATIEGAGGTATAVVADVGDAEAPRRIIDAVVGAWGRIDVLVNNAAHIKQASIEQVTVEDFDRHIAVNVRGPFLLSQAALPYLRKAPAPSIVNVSSASAVMALPGEVCYATTKAAIEHLTKLMASELAPIGIRVNCIQPGGVDTRIHLVYAADDPEDRIRRLTALIPRGRMATAKEIAHWIVEMTTPEASHVTGAILRVDGGLSLPGATVGLHTPEAVRRAPRSSAGVVARPVEAVEVV